MNSYDTLTSQKIAELPVNMTVSDVADFLGLSITTAYKLVHADDFPKLQLTSIRRVIIPKHQFLKWYLQDDVEYITL